MCIRDSRFPNLLYQINVRTLLLRTYYRLFEQDVSYYSLLITQCESFIKFLQRNHQLNENKKQAMLLFPKLLKSIAETQFANKFDVQKKQHFIEIINRSNGVSLKGWLLEILHNLDKKNLNNKE